MRARVLYYIPVITTMVFFTGGCSTLLTAGGWKYLGTTNWGEIKHYVNLKNVRKMGETVTVQSKNVFAKAESAAFLPGKKYNYDVDQWEINCNKSQAKLLAVDFYDGAGQIIFHQTITNPSQGAIPKGSILSQVYGNVCR